MISRLLILFSVLSCLILINCKEDDEVVEKDEVVTISSGRRITNEAELDQLRGVTKITGNLTITGSEIESLEALSSLESIAGSLEIAQTGLQNLSGLEDLEAIGGKLEIRSNGNLDTIALNIREPIISMYIQSNEKLSVFAGFHELESINGNLEISNNSYLKTIGGFDNLIKIQKSLSITKNPQLEELTGFNSLEETIAHLKIQENGLVSINGFKNLKKVWGDLVVDEPTLQQIIGLSPSLIGQSLTLIAPSLMEIWDLSQLLELRAESLSVDDYNKVNLENLEIIGGTLVIETDVLNNNFAKLESVQGLYFKGSTLTKIPSFPDLKMIGSAGVTFEQLSIDEKLIFDSPSNISGGIRIRWTSFSEVDFPNISNVDYLVLRYNENLRRVGPFDSLKTVINQLRIDRNQALAAIYGFNSLETSKDVFIEENEDLRTISGFDKVSSLGGLSIQKNPSLFSIEGFGGDLYIDQNIILSENNQLQTISAFENILSCGGLYFAGNDLIEDLAKSFDRLESADNIDFDGNSLKVLPNFEMLRSVENQISISSMNNLGCIGGFPKLETVESVTIQFNNSLASISGFAALKETGLSIHTNGNLEIIDAFETLLDGIISIDNNKKLVVLKAFDLMESGGVSIRYNENLQNLPEFSSLKKASVIAIRYNSDLRSISGFDGLDDAGTISIVGNTSITEINGFNSLANISNTLRIEQNDSLANLNSSFDNLVSLDAIEVGSNSNLVSLDSFKSLKDVSLFSLQGNSKLSNLSFSQIDETSNLVIIDNDNLTNLDGLSSLRTILWGVEIRNNSSLVDFCGLSSTLFDFPEVDFQVSSNGYNPSMDQIFTDECSN